MTSPKRNLCPCVCCQIDAAKGKPLRLARWRDTGRWWAPFRGLPIEGTTREAASLFGPRHAGVLRANPSFVIVKPRRTPCPEPTAR
jgi:hypothetical protein